MGSEQRSVNLPLPLGQVFLRLSDPACWPEWMPDMVGTPEVEGDGSPGTVVKVKMKALGLTQPFRVEVTHSQMGEGEAKWSAEISNFLVKAREQWSFASDSGGTQADWHYEYAAKGGPLAGLIERALLGKVIADHMNVCVGSLRAGCASEAEQTSGPSQSHS